MLRKHIYFLFVLVAVTIFFATYQRLPPLYNDILYFLFAVFAFGAISIYLLKHEKNVVVNVQDIKAYLNLPFLGYSPYMKSREKDQSIFELREQKPSLKSSFLKIKELLISFSSEKKPLKVLGVTSVCSQEGKSSCSVNLAISYAEDKEDTLFIDADLRQKEVNFLKTKDYKGLSDFLSENCSFQEAIASTELVNLFFLPRGSVFSNPQELLKSERFNDLIGEAKKRFKKIVINLSPVLTCADFFLVGGKCDGVVLTVLAKNTHLNLLLKAKKILNKKTKVIGAVLNTAV